MQNSQTRKGLSARFEGITKLFLLTRARPISRIVLYELKRIVTGKKKTKKKQGEISNQA